MTWRDIAIYVTEIVSKEGAKPNPAFLRALGRQALNIIAEQTRLVEGAWDNDSGGALTIDGYTVNLPSDCLIVTRVELDGSDSPLERKSLAQIDKDHPGWREDTGDPSCYCIKGRAVLLNSAPGVATGRLVVRGVAALPDFSDDTSADNPLDWLPPTQRLAPAYYILAQLPVQPDNQAEVLRQERHAAMWRESLDAIISAALNREYEPFEF